ncbi:hypothetical protein BIW11_03940 [Tropilaelaps mercedesae]|uniref:Uncharacterized protein n=1 Tax=Tropilaelaps mercedesae TaxID=418985 RepID=A0A1V9XDI5_9ACAR|nr:hypothetical protein BIW11_03940 [Tropilaelaps mercedesae]
MIASNTLCNPHFQLCNFECQREITRALCNCTPQAYPFLNKLSENVCDPNVTAECVQTRSKARYNIECPNRCRQACEYVSL